MQLSDEKALESLLRLWEQTRQETGKQSRTRFSLSRRGRKYDRNGTEPQTTCFRPAETKLTVAVVDDEPSVRRFVALALTQAGYQAIEARDGLEANELLKKRAVALLISDIRMPGGNGLDLGVALQTSQPGLPVLYISGLIDSVAVQSILLKDPLAILAKPFTAEALIERVQVLTGSAIATMPASPMMTGQGSGWNLNVCKKGPGTEGARLMLQKDRK